MNIHELRPTVEGTLEKITIDRGILNLLVLEPFHSDRADHIRTAARHQLAIRAGLPHKTASPKTFARPAALPPSRSGGHAGSRTNSQAPGAETSPHRNGYTPRTCAGDDRLDRRIRRAIPMPAKARTGGPDQATTRAAPKEIRPNECTT